MMYFLIDKIPSNIAWRLQEVLEPLKTVVKLGEDADLETIRTWFGHKATAARKSDFLRRAEKMHHYLNSQCQSITFVGKEPGSNMGLKEARTNRLSLRRCCYAPDDTIEDIVKPGDHHVVKQGDIASVYANRPKFVKPGDHYVVDENSIGMVYRNRFKRDEKGLPTFVPSGLRIYIQTQNAESRNSYHTLATLAHEFSHCVLGTEDYFYGTENCQYLARYGAFKQVINNADNWGYFYADIAFEKGILPSISATHVRYVR